MGTLLSSPTTLRRGSTGGGIIDIYFEVQGGRIVSGKVYSDCLFADYITHLNKLLESGNYLYDVQGIQQICADLSRQFADNADLVNYTAQFEEWLKKKSI